MYTYNFVSCDLRKNKIIRTAKKILLQPFEDIISGFVDTLPLFKKFVPKKKSYKLSTLTQDHLNISIENAHNAIFDVDMLEQLTIKFIPVNEILSNQKSVRFIIDRSIKNENIPIVSKTFQPMAGILSDQLIKKLAKNGFDFNFIVDKFMSGGSEQLKSFLTGKDDNGTEFLKRKGTIDEIITFCETLKNMIDNNE